MTLAQACFVLLALQGAIAIQISEGKPPVKHHKHHARDQRPSWLHEVAHEQHRHATNKSSKKLGASISFPGVTWVASTLTEGAQCWTDRSSYHYSSVSTSNIPSGTMFWMGPHKIHTSGSFTITATQSGTLYFWSENSGRDGGFQSTYSGSAIGSMKWNGHAMTTYSMAVTSGSTVTFHMATSEFVGGFAWGAVASPTPSPAYVNARSWPTPHPTFPQPRTAGAPGGGVAATGDPHLANVLGQRFDLMKPGKHILVNIPRGRNKNVLLRVQADARQLGGLCADMYFQELNITGQWVKATGGGDLRFHAQGVHDEHPKWLKFGKVELKVAHGRTLDGFQYLNFYVKHLGHAGFAVGGLLGEDDHEEAAMPSEACAHRASLLQEDGHSASSVAEASFV